MPQLDPSSFASQIFWLVVTFVALYLLLWRVVLPRIAGVLETRQNRIEDDLGRARAAKEEAEAVLEAYEKAMAESRTQAHAVVKAAADDMAAEAHKQTAALGAKINDELKAAEARIAEARNEAMGSVQQVAAQAAGEAVKRLAGLEVSAAEAEAAVGAVTGGKS